MNRLVIVLMVCFVAAQPVAAQKSEVVSMVTRFVEAFNKGDAAGIVTSCAEKTAIIDEFPPYEWQGEGACMKWLNDWSVDAETRVITDAWVTLGDPRHVDVTGDRAYVVMPVDYTFKMDGKPMKETGSRLTLVLRHGEAGWKATSWTWSKN